MASRVRINPEEEVILPRSVLNDAVEIGRLKGTVKNNLLIEVKGRIHSLESSIIQASFIEVVGP